MKCRKIAFRPCFLSRNDGGYSINPFCPVVFAIDDACLPVSVRLAYSPHAVLSRSILGLSFVILSQHLSRNNKPWCPEMCPRSSSINIWRAPKVNDDTLSARHCVTECIYSIYPGTKVWGSSAWHRSLQIREASCSKQATQLSPRADEKSPAI